MHIIVLVIIFTMFVNAYAANQTNNDDMLHKVETENQPLIYAIILFILVGILYVISTRTSSKEKIESHFKNLKPSDLDFVVNHTK